MDRRLGRPLPHQLPNPTRADPLPINLSPVGHIRYYPQFPEAIPKQRARSHALLTRPPLPLRGARLACVRPAASVRSEPGSNSQVESCFQLSLTSNLRTSAWNRSPKTSSVHVPSYRSNVTHKTVKLYPSSSLHPVSRTSLKGRYASFQTPMRPNRPHIPSFITVSKSADTKITRPPIPWRVPQPHIQIVPGFRQTSQPPLRHSLSLRFVAAVVR